MAGVLGEAVEAARLLAMHSRDVVPLLITAFEGLDREDAAKGKWVYYALGRCATEESVDALKRYALQHENCWWTNTTIHALSLAGDRGEEAIKELEPVAEGNLKISIQHYRRGRLGESESDIQFPEIQTEKRLPKDVKEWRLPR